MAVASEKVLWRVPPTSLKHSSPKWLLLQKSSLEGSANCALQFISQSPPGVKVAWIVVMFHAYKSSPQKTTHHVVAVGVFFGFIFWIVVVPAYQMNLNMRPMKLHRGHWIMTGSAFASVGRGSLCNNAGQQGSTRWQDIFSSAARQSIWLLTLSENFHTRDFQKAFQFHPSGSFSTELHPLSLLIIILCFLVVGCAQTMARPCRWLNMIEEPSMFLILVLWQLQFSRSVKRPCAAKPEWKLQLIEHIVEKYFCFFRAGPHH